MAYETPTFLIVDDDAVSVMAVKRMISKLRLVNPVVVAKDGQEALDVLRGTEEIRALEGPYIVILDINMPRMTGHEFLKELRADPRLQSTIVFVMSTSEAPADIRDAYRTNVAGYIVKNGSPQSFRAALDMLGTYSEVVLVPENFHFAS